MNLAVSRTNMAAEPRYFYGFGVLWSSRSRINNRYRTKIYHNTEFLWFRMKNRLRCKNCRCYCNWRDIDFGRKDPSWKISIKLLFAWNSYRRVWNGKNMPKRQKKGHSKYAFECANSMPRKHRKYALRKIRSRSINISNRVLTNCSKNYNYGKKIKRKKSLNSKICICRFLYTFSIRVWWYFVWAINAKLNK